MFKTHDNMKVLNYLTILFGVLILTLFSCEEKEFIDPTPTGRMEQVFFQKDTFVFKESNEVVSFSVLASKYLNYSTKIGIEITDLNLPDSIVAKEGTHFHLLTREVKIPLGESEGEFQLRLVDDTIVNPDRVFAVDIKTIEGGGFAAETKQRAIIIIKNDDFIPEASIVFPNKTMRVGEEDGELLVPFNITKASQGEVTVHFGASKGDNTSAQAFEGIDFNIMTPKVTLPAGELDGFVKLEIIDNLIPHDDNNFNLVVKEVLGAEIGEDSICNITIVNDDLDRLVAFAESELFIPEDAGEVEVPLHITGGSDPSALVSGTIVIDSLFGGAKKEDIVILNPNFSSAGDEIIPIKFKIKDNDEFGAWGARVVFRNLNQVRATTRRVIVNVVDDERIIQFEETEIEIDEDGSPINIGVKLLGGLAEKDIRANLLVVESTTTAPPEHYKIPLVVRIDQSTNTGSFTFEPFKHPSKEDKMVSLQLEVIENEKILLSDSSLCHITIVNTDGAVGFTTRGETVLGHDTYTLPISLTGFEEPVSIKFAINAPSDITTYFTDIIDNTLHIVPGALDAKAKLYVTRQQNPIPSSLEVSIESITMGGKDVTEELINPEGITYKLNTSAIENNPLDRSTWTIAHVSSEEAVGEGANNGRAKHMLDNNTGTFWHSRWQGGTDPQPFIIVVDMQKPTAVTEASVHIRNGTNTVQIEVGDNADDWTSIGTITLDGAGEAHKKLIVDENTAIIGRYLRLTVNGNHSTIRELYVNGTQL